MYYTHTYRYVYVYVYSERDLHMFMGLGYVVVCIMYNVWCVRYYNIDLLIIIVDIIACTCNIQHARCYVLYDIVSNEHTWICIIEMYFCYNVIPQVVQAPPHTLTTPMERVDLSLRLRDAENISLLNLQGGPP